MSLRIDRREGQRIDVTHVGSGESLPITVKRIDMETGQVVILFGDREHCFEVAREEWKRRKAEAAMAAERAGRGFDEGIEVG